MSLRFLDGAEAVAFGREETGMSRMVDWLWWMPCAFIKRSYLFALDRFWISTSEIMKQSMEDTAMNW